MDKPKKKRRSWHAKEQEWPELTVSSIRREDWTEVLPEEEEIVKPATEGTEIPYEAIPSQSTINTHTTTTKIYPKPYPRKYVCSDMQDLDKSCIK